MPTGRQPSWSCAEGWNFGYYVIRRVCFSVVCTFSMAPKCKQSTSRGARAPTLLALAFPFSPFPFGPDHEAGRESESGTLSSENFLP